MSNRFKVMVTLSSIIITILIVFSMRSQIELYNKLVYDKEVVQSQLEVLQNDIFDLEKEVELIGTDEYIERIAREKLGYIKPNEFIFREK